MWCQDKVLDVRKPLRSQGEESRISNPKSEGYRRCTPSRVGESRHNVNALWPHVKEDSERKKLLAPTVASYGLLFQYTVR